MLRIVAAFATVAVGCLVPIAGRVKALALLTLRDTARASQRASGRVEPGSAMRNRIASVASGSAATGNAVRRV
jgi:hypothetical protein